MTSSEDQALSGAILEESALLTVKDLSRMCAVDERHIVEFVEEGVLNVIEINATEWRFSGAALRELSNSNHLDKLGPIANELYSAVHE